MRRDLAPALLALAALGGCLEPAGPRHVDVAELRVTLGPAHRALDTIQVRATSAIQLQALGSRGEPAATDGVRIASSDERVATVTTLGTVQGVAPGTAIITATAPNGKVGTATVVVTPATVAYAFAVGATPTALGFSTDYARAYVAIAPDSLAIVDALGFSRIGAIAVGLPAHRVAATQAYVYVTHPDADSVSLVSTATRAVAARLFVGAGPRGVVATPTRAFVAASLNHTIAVLEGSAVVGRIAIGGEPHELAITRDGRRIMATVARDDGWYLMLIDAAALDTLGSVRLPHMPSSVSVSADGTRGYVLFPTERLAAVYVENGAPGRLTSSGAVPTGADPGGIAAKQGGEPYVVVSGSPLVIFHGGTLQVVEQVDDAGDGFLLVRPDGVFAFVCSPSTGGIRVVAGE